MSDFLMSEFRLTVNRQQSTMFIIIDHSFVTTFFNTGLTLCKRLIVLYLLTIHNSSLTYFTHH